ncbi:MAG: hypothetical protein V3V08_00300 [Nannocystaceae bacterium]
MPTSPTVPRSFTPSILSGVPGIVVWRSVVAAAQGVGLVCGLVGIGACESTVELDIRLVMPEESDSLERTHHVSVVVQPQGLVRSFDVQGIDFDAPVAVIPSDQLSTVTTYLARDTTLLGWGSTVPFPTLPLMEDVAAFIGLPGRLSTFPTALSTPDPQMLASYAPARGIVMLHSDGATFLMNHYTYDVDRAASLSPPPQADDGGLFPAADGAVMRVAWKNGLAAWRFDPGEDMWAPVDLPAGSVLGPRGGAVVLPDGHQRLLFFGGGGALDAFSLDLVPTADGVLAVSWLEGSKLASTRTGATAVWIDHGADQLRDVVLFGGSDAAAPLVALWGGAPVAGDMRSAWTGAACASVGALPEASATSRVVCVGGVRDGEATADGVLIEHTLGAAQTCRFELLPDLLPRSIPEPLAFPFPAESLLYVQGEGALVRVETVELTTYLQDAGAERGGGGQAVRLPTGATFLLAGTAADGSPASRIQVLVPPLDGAAGTH